MLRQCWIVDEEGIGEDGEEEGRVSRKEWLKREELVKVDWRRIPQARGFGEGGWD